MTRDPHRVFLNVPFDSAYEPILIGLVAALVHLGMRPITVLQLRGAGSPRLDHLLALIRGSGFSVHDLSRVGLSGHGRGAVPRFNMPFELGLAVAVARLQRSESAHAFALLETRQFRLQRSLSDLNGFDPLIHNGTRAGAVRCMFEIFAESAPTDLPSALRLAGRLARVSKQLKRDHGAPSVFSRVVFNELFTAATLLRERDVVVVRNRGLDAAQT
jgi:hypothetical protein